MNQSSEELVQKLGVGVQSEIKLILEDILYSAKERKECLLSGKKIPGKDLAKFLALCYLDETSKILFMRITNLTIVGQLDLDSMTIKFPLVFKDCIFKDNDDDENDKSNILLRNAKTKFLSFEGCECQHINASRIDVDGQLWLNRKFHAANGIELNNSKINGNIYLNNATISSYKDTNKTYQGNSLVLDGATISGNLILSDIKSEGEISLISATIEGNIICRNACVKSLMNKHGKSLALIANSATVKGSIELNEGFNSQGQILLMNMNVSGDIKCDGGTFRPSILPDGEQLNDYNRDCFIHAISFDRSEIVGSISMDSGFIAEGQVRLIGTTIKNDLKCNGGSFSLSHQAKYTNKDKYTICIAKSIISGDVTFSSGKHGGVIFLNNVQIDSNLEIKGIEFQKNKIGENGLFAQNCTIGEYIHFENMSWNDETIIDLSGSHSGGVNHNWNYFIPPNCKIKSLVLDGFSYNKYAYNSNKQNGSNLALDKPTEWLRLYNCSLGCYKQLAGVLIKQEKPNDAREVLIAMEERKYPNLSWKEIISSFNASHFKIMFLFLYSKMLKHFTGYGYMPFRIIKFSIIFIVFSMLIFTKGYEQNAFHSKAESTTGGAIGEKNPPSTSSPNAKSDFNPLIFSIETFIPMNQNHWEIKDEHKFLYVYSFIHAILGWLCSLFIALGIKANISNKVVKISS